MTRPGRDGAAGPLTGLAGRIRRTMDAIDDADGPPGKADVHARHVLEDRLDALVPLVGQERPRTAVEAMLQLAVAMGAVEDIMGRFGPGERDEAGRHEALAVACLYGVLGWIEDVAGAPLDERLSGYWMCRACDPHPVLDRLSDRPAVGQIG